MRRVMLFVDGIAEPTFAGYAGPLGERPWQRRPVALESALGEMGITSAQQASIESGSGWWLVEAESVKAGRQVIALHTGENTWCLDGSDPQGRILAQGGAS